MNAVAASRFPIKPVVAALALAFGSLDALADPTPAQLPGAGQIRAVGAGTTITSPNGAWQVSGGGVGGEIYNGSLAASVFPGSIQLNSASSIARAVIRWGGNGSSLETFNPQGFNIGSNATVYFTSGGNVTDAAVLNVDASGNPSQIFGQLISTSSTLGGAAGGGAAPVVFLANSNGIVVGKSGLVSLPNGGGLIGANLNHDTDWFEFVGNNGEATSYLNLATGFSTVQVHGVIDGGLEGGNTNRPAAYVLLAGGDVVNTGNIFGANIAIVAGMRPVAGSDTVNGVSKVTVNRLWNIDAAAFAVSADECTLTGCLEVGRSGSTFVNTGSIASTENFDSKQPPPDLTGITAREQVGGYGNIDIRAAKGIRSGTQGNGNTSVGLFVDADISTNVYEAGGMTELYNVVGRYSEAPGKYIASLAINQAQGWDGDVVIEALTRASAPSSVTTNGEVNIRGVNVTVNSTINHALNPDNSEDTNIESTNSMTIKKDIGAGGMVNLTNSGAGGINISGNVQSDLDNGGYGGINVTNEAAGSPTTISGTLTARGYSTGDLSIDVNGPLNITGNLYSLYYDVGITNHKAGASTVVNNAVTSAAEGTVDIRTHGNTDISSAITAGNSFYLYNDAIPSATTTSLAGSVLADYIDIHNNAGTGSNLNISSTLTALESFHVFSHGNLRLAAASAHQNSSVDVDGLAAFLTGPIAAASNMGYATFSYNAPNAVTRVATDATISAATVNLQVLNFKGVRNDGSDYTSTAQKPAFQVAAYRVNLVAYGSVNAPLTAASNPQGDWLKNSLWLKPFTPDSSVELSISALGGGFQAINLGVVGDVFVNSGTTTTPFYATGYAQPSFFPPIPQGNVGSSLIVQSTGNLDIVAPLTEQSEPSAVVPTPVAPVQFLFPGGVAFKAGGYLAINVPVNNAWTFTPAPYQGQWYEAATIIDSGYHATNSGSWINYSSYPVTGPGTAYSITQPMPGSFQFVNTPDAKHYNVYSTAILGAPLCNVPNPAAPWPPAGC
ncbi:MAG: hypothetical protein U1F48_13825 [Burkholderiales bacterium]